MTLKSDWVKGESFGATDANAVATAVNGLEADLTTLESTVANKSFDGGSASSVYGGGTTSIDGGTA